MNLILTLLPLFLGGEPTTANLPPEPAAASVETEDNRFRGYRNVGVAAKAPHLFGAESTDSPAFSLRLVAPVHRHLSPSWMVAVPPVPPPAPFDVFSPAVRPPHEFPALFPCGPVALVPCPAPSPAAEAPAVRHVSFAGEGAEFHISDARSSVENACSSKAPQKLPFGNGTPYSTHPLVLPHPAAFLPPGFGPEPIRSVFFEEMHARAQTPQHPSPSCYEDPYCPFDPQGSVCPVGLMCPVAHQPFPGAKNVAHVVRATYEVPHKTAKILEHLLAGRAGVLETSVAGDELTISANAPAQMAIAAFLTTVVNQPQEIQRPAKAINVRHTKTEACTGQCAEAKSGSEKSECKAECQCDCKEGQCGGCCDMPKPAVHDVSTSKTCEPAAFRCYVGIRDCETSMPGDNDWVAIVNGSPILACEVLERYGAQLAQAKDKLSSEQFDEARRKLLQRDLDDHIERKLMAEALKQTLTPEQKTKLTGFIDQAFEKEVARLMEEFDVNTKSELEKTLRKKHISLGNLKTNFADHQLAMEWIGLQKKACSTECSEAACSNGKCTNKDCACKDECECQGPCENCGKTKPAVSGAACSKACEPAELPFDVRIPAFSDITCSKEDRSRIFSFYIGLLRGKGECAQADPAQADYGPVAVDLQYEPACDRTKQPARVRIRATADGINVHSDQSQAEIIGKGMEFEADSIDTLKVDRADVMMVNSKNTAKTSKPIRISIQRTSEGVELETSDGTKIRAKVIQLETKGIGKIKVQHSDKATNPKQEIQPAGHEDASASNTETNTGFFQLAGPYSAVNESEENVRYFRFGGVELRR